MTTTATTASSFDVRAPIHAIIPNVFDTMLGLPLAPARADATRPGDGLITGFVGIGGENVCGAVYLHFPEALAQQAAAAMLGLGAGETAADADVNDVVGELCNMVAGGLKGLLCDAGLPCAISAPAIVRGGDYSIETSEDVPRQKFFFDCQEHRLAVEVHLKTN